MVRYLSPSKVALLALVSIYAENVVPNSATIPVLSFIISHILHDSRSAAEAGNSGHTVPIEAFETALSSAQSSFPGRSFWDLFLKKIWSLDCSDALDSFVTNIKDLTKSKAEIEQDNEEAEVSEDRVKIVKTSPLGAFIRRAHLEYIRLQIHDATRLWENFIAYRLPTRHAWEKRNPGADTRSAIDVNLDAMNLHSSSILAQIIYRNLGEDDRNDGGYSAFDVDGLLEFQVSEMQRLGSRLPDSMKSRLTELSKTKAAKPGLSHYLAYLDSWRAGDYASAFDNLHRYFDYSMQSRDRTFYQYALLNLAILQADFGCYSEAVPAMQEAIATARENKDMNCLNFCMSWLYHFNKAYPEETKEIQNSGMLGSEVEALNFLKSKAKDAEMWSLLSTTLLSEAKLGLQNGESIAIAFEGIAKSAHLNVTKGVTSVVGPNLILKSSVCNRVGLSRLAWSQCEVFMQCYLEDAPMEDKLKCLCRIANLKAQQGHSNKALAMLADVTELCGEDVLRVLKYSQYRLFFSGLLKLRQFLHRNDLSAADTILNQLKGQGAPDLDLSFSLSLLEIDYLIRSADYATAIHKISKIVESKSPIANDVFAQIRLLNLKALALCKSGIPTHAFSITVRAATMANRARILPALWESVATLSEILISLNELVAATKLLESILPAVLETLEFDLAARVYSLLVDATVGQAGQLSPAPSTPAHLAASKPTSPTTETKPSTTSSASNSSPRTPKSKTRLSTTTKTHSSLPPPPATTTTTTTRKQEDLLSASLSLLESAYTYYEKMEDYKGMMEMLAKRAMVFRALGDWKAAEEVSERWIGVRGLWREELVE